LTKLPTMVIILLRRTIDELERKFER
jgi:hypothetical protein